MKRLLLLSCLLLGSCAKEAAGPNIVLITLDTLRADRLGCYGNPNALSPSIDRFAEDATLYSRAHAVSPWTLPSHASLFTGLYPFEHGAHSYRVDVEPYYKNEGVRKPVDNVFPLPESETTLAEILRASGYQTAAIVANNTYLDPLYGCAQGFDSYEVLPETGDVVVDRALEWLDGRGGESFLLFLNFMDTHSPYNISPREGWEDLGTPAESSELLSKLNDSILPGKGSDPEELELLRRQYDLSVANLDEQIGRLFRELEARGLYEDTLILLTSDHGEYLGEHKLIGHSKDVYQEAIAVPFLLKRPRQERGGTDARLLSLVHVMDLLAQDCPPLQDTPRAHPFPESAILAENYYSRIKDLQRPWAARFKRCRGAVYANDHKFIHSTDRRHELYDLSKDPLEEDNLVLELKEKGAQLNTILLGTLYPRFNSLSAVAEIDSLSNLRELSQEEQDRLRSLGYF